MDAEARHRTLQLLGIELRDWKVQPRDPGGEDGGQWVKSGGLAKKVAGVIADAAGWHRDLSDHGDLIAAIDSGETARHSLDGGKMGDVFLVDHSNGASTVEKHLGDIADIMGPGFEPERQADAEQLAATLGRAIGAPVPRVLRTADDKVSIELVNGDSWKFIEDQIDDPTDEDLATLQAVKDRLIGSREGIRLGLFDLLIDNFDRPNGTNWFVEDGTNRPVGIDHAIAWPMEDDPSNAPAGWALSPFSESFVDPPSAYDRLWKANGNPPRDWIDNPLTDDDVEYLRNRLAEVEDDFTEIGRHDWWEFASARLEAIAQHAAGEEPIFT